MSIVFSPKRIALILGGVSLYLSIQSIVGKAIEYAVGMNNTWFIYNMVKLFNVNREGNIPTWFASTMLLACAVLLVLIALAVRRQRGRYGRHWRGLALIFLYLTVDEAAAIHEKLTIPLQESLGASGYVYFAWVLVGLPFAVVVGLLYVRFLLHLPGRTRTLFLIAGALYVGAALGIEAIGANRWFADDGTSLAYSAIGTVEELFEMLGVVVFIYALMEHLRSLVGDLRVTIGTETA